jgi:hypothetical protein
MRIGLTIEDGKNKPFELNRDNNITCLNPRTDSSTLDVQRSSQHKTEE